jgi:hypothetical protein
VHIQLETLSGAMGGAAGGHQASLTLCSLASILSVKLLPHQDSQKKNKAHIPVFSGNVGKMAELVQGVRLRL